jgi:hypothetical protein
LNRFLAPTEVSQAPPLCVVPERCHRFAIGDGGGFRFASSTLRLRLLHPPTVSYVLPERCPSFSRHRQGPHLGTQR